MFWSQTNPRSKCQPIQCSTRAFVPVAHCWLLGVYPHDRRRNSPLASSSKDTNPTKKPPHSWPVYLPKVLSPNTIILGWYKYKSWGDINIQSIIAFIYWLSPVSTSEPSLPLSTFTYLCLDSEFFHVGSNPAITASGHWLVRPYLCSPCHTGDTQQHLLKWGICVPSWQWLICHWC